MTHQSSRSRLRIRPSGKAERKCSLANNRLPIPDSFYAIGFFCFLNLPNYPTNPKNIMSTAQQIPFIESQDPEMAAAIRGEENREAMA